MMKNKIFTLFRILFAIFLFVFAVYILMIFFAPEIADSVGNVDFNEKVRNIKNDSLKISSPDGSLNLSF